MVTRIGDVLFLLGLLIAALTGIAFAYLVAFGSGPSAEAGRLVMSTICITSIMVGTAFRYILKA